MEVLEYLRELNMVSMMLRIVLAMIMGGIIGFEREMKHRPAGFRTYMLVAAGRCYQRSGDIKEHNNKERFIMNRSLLFVIHF